MRNWEEEYTASTNLQLFAYHKSNGFPLPPTLASKSADSFLLKTRRLNALDNRNWPEPPEGGWVEPATWLEQVTDVVRCQFVVRYLDGAERLVAHLDAVADRLNLSFTYKFEARPEGYYAAHCAVSFTADLPTSIGTRLVPMQAEIQIATQFQDVLRVLTHRYYEQRRVTAPLEGSVWQWEYGTDQFFSSYLGHLLHYVDVMIMEVRARQLREATK